MNEQNSSYYNIRWIGTHVQHPTKHATSLLHNSNTIHGHIWSWLHGNKYNHSKVVFLFYLNSEIIMRVSSGLPDKV